jgi:hypothetical protein
MLKLSTAPTTEPVTVAEAKAHLRVDAEVAEEDTLIAAYISAAREYCEGFQNRAYVTQTWELWLDEWPETDHIDIPLPPLQEPSVTAGAFVTGVTYRILTVGTTTWTSIGAAASTVGTVFTATGAGSGTGTATASGIVKYYDTTDTEAYMSGADYLWDIKSEPGRLCLGYGKSWPSTTLRPHNGICVTFIAGYGAAAAVPKAVRQAMLLLIGHWYEHRESVNIGNITTEIPMTVESLLWMTRVF